MTSTTTTDDATAPDKENGVAATFAGDAAAVELPVASEPSFLPPPHEVLLDGNGAVYGIRRF